MTESTLRIAPRLALTALLPAIVLFFAGCASQVRSPQVGDTVRDQRELRFSLAEQSARSHYDRHMPKVGATIRSDPQGALVEWYNSDGIWVSVGSTPTREIVIEASGKPELFRVSKPGYMPQTRWVAATPGSQGVTVSFNLQPELPTDRFIFRDQALSRE